MGFGGSRVDLRRLRRLRSACRAEPGTACFAGGRVKSRRPDWVKVKPHRKVRGGAFSSLRPRVRASGGRLWRFALLRCHRGRRTSSTISIATLARSDGPVARPKVQCTHAPVTIAKGRRSMAHGTHWGRNAPDATPRRITADSVHVARCTSSRRAKSALKPWCRLSSDGSDVARSTISQMASTVSRRAAVGWPADLSTRSSDCSCRSTAGGRSELIIAWSCPRARVRLAPPFPAAAAVRRTASAPEWIRSRPRGPGRSGRPAIPGQATARRRPPASASH